MDRLNGGPLQSVPSTLGVVLGERMYQMVDRSSEGGLR